MLRTITTQIFSNEQRTAGERLGNNLNSAYHGKLLRSTHLADMLAENVSRLLPIFGSVSGSPLTSRG